jgi:hypothetical protein
MRLSNFLAAGVLIAWAAPAAADVQLSIQNGQVSLKATNATAREILAEWTKIGRTQIVNGERVPGGPMTIQLTDVTEDQALKVILRSAAGYVTAPRRTAAPDGSRFDRILVMPTTSPARGAAPPPAAFPQPQVNPQFQQPPFPQPPAQFRQPNQDDTIADDPTAGPPRGPIFNTFPQPQISPQQPVPPGVRPATPLGGPAPAVGAPVPGMVVPAPTQPGQPGMPQPIQREP